MKMNTPIGATPFDTQPQGVLGAPLDRVDGRLKVTGGARYAYEVREAGQPLYGYIVQSTIAKGRITTLDTAAAEALPGVRLVLTHRTTPPQGTGIHREAAPQMTGPDILNFGQPVALVVAEQFEQARAAAMLVRVAYDKQAADVDLRLAAAKAITPKAAQAPTDTAVGDFEAGFAQAPVQLDVTYDTPLQSHAMMEPHATIARWDRDKLTLWTSNQMLNQGVKAVAKTLQMPEENVRLVSKYIGGGFGAKLWVGSDAILAAIAAKQLNQPVKVGLTRQQVFAVTTHRSDTIQRIRLGADHDGTLLAIGHESLSGNRDGEGYEAAALQTRALYAGANRMTRHRMVPLSVPIASAMRAPGEAVGLLALECAMDELAEKLGLDPIALRVRNEPAEDPEKHIPYSARNLLPCLQRGAEVFGWDKRGSKPGQVSDGRWLVGMGVAASIRANPLQASSARVRLDRDGVVTVQMAMTDIGTGTYTILSQIAAELLGLPMEKIRTELGDTTLPKASGSGGSFGAGSSGSALYEACMALRGKIAGMAGLDPDTAVFSGGTVSANGVSKPLAGLAGPGGLSAEGDIDPGDMSRRFSQQAYGAQFAEVGVDRDTGEVRLRRMLGVFTAGRILNPKTARSQAIGGMIFGVGAALSEELILDPRTGHFVNHDLAEYLVPVHADIPAVEALFLPELDDKSNPLKSKGIGELGICGAGAAVANAVYNACGVRIRDYPLSLDKVLAGMDSRA